MDTITHALPGAVIGYCGFRQRGGRVALWTTIAAAEFPDTDIVMASFGGETYLRWHRSSTHSALMLPVWATVVAGIFWAFSRRSDFKLLWLAAAAGPASHLLLDWLTSYGTLLLWLFTDARFALSWVFIVDVYVWAMLLVALIVAIRTQRAVVGRAALGFVGVYFLFCDASRAYALHTASQAPATVRLDAFPQPMNPLRWTIVRADSATVHWISGRHNDTFVQFQDDELLPKAEAVKLFRWFAEFPIVEKIHENGLTVLRYRDLRFRTVFPNSRVNDGMFVVAKVTFDSNGKVIASSLGSAAE